MRLLANEGRASTTSQVWQRRLQDLHFSLSSPAADFESRSGVLIHYAERGNAHAELDLPPWFHSGLLWAYYQLSDGREFQTGFV
jgi:hypothetical protein